jgi:hypothetical protein
MMTRSRPPDPLKVNMGGQEATTEATPEVSSEDVVGGRGGVGGVSEEATEAADFSMYAVHQYHIVL